MEYNDYRETLRREGKSLLDRPQGLAESNYGFDQRCVIKGLFARIEKLKTSDNPEVQELAHICELLLMKG